MSKLLRALDSQELADVTGTGLALGSFKNKLSETLHEPHHVQTPYGVETRHHQLQPASSACEKGLSGRMHGILHTQ